MRLVGNVSFKNELKDSPCMVGETVVNFVLPRNIRNRHRLVLKYFGYYATLHSSNPDYGGHTYSVFNGDATDLDEYIYRGQVREVTMGVETDNGDLMHESIVSSITDNADGVSGRYRENSQGTISFPAVSETQAAYHDGVSILPYSDDFPLSVTRGHSKLYDLPLGYVEANSSFIKVKLKAKSIPVPDLTYHSGEPNVRMDSISFVLELK